MCVVSNVDPVPFFLNANIPFDVIPNTSFVSALAYLNSLTTLSILNDFAA